MPLRKREKIQKMLRKNNLKIPLGFLTSSCNCGIKKKERDLALFLSDSPAFCAGVFTTNRVKAAPVILSSKIVKRGYARGIVANSGNANALTGREGIDDAKRIIKSFARSLGIDENELLIASTGVIGRRLPVEKIISKADFLSKNLSSDKRSFIDSARAIMTTDSFYKIHSREVKTKEGNYTILGIAKGAGMICPSMATMLCFIFTDAKASSGLLKEALTSSVEKSFNRITVDGDRSTNDTVFILANGKSGISVEKGKDRISFFKELEGLCLSLAMDIVRDGEGATKTFSVTVEGAPDEGSAKKIAYSVANSPLVKTAVHGRQPNFGRIVASAGASGVKFDPFKLRVWVNGMLVVKNGKVLEVKGNPFSEKKLEIRLNIGEGGKGKAEVISCDLSPEYVRINAGYLT